MKKRSLGTRNGGGSPRARLGTKVVAAIATFALVMSMCPGAAVLAFANGQLAAGAGDLEAQTLSAQGEDVHELTSGIGWLSAGTWIVPEGKTVDLGWYKWDTNALKVAPGATVHLIIEKNAVLKARGGDAVGSGVGRAAILLPESSTLIVSGEGKLIATGGNAGNGEQGQGAKGSGFVSRNGGPKLAYTASGGNGGNGGGGAGAGIGTDGGAGGSGGSGGGGVEQAATKANTYGNPGKPGGSGSSADPAGTLIVTGSVTVNAKGGLGNQGGGAGSRGNYYDGDGWSTWAAYGSGTSGGGGGGGGGTAADGIGCGGTGGGGGGGGASGNIDGECAFFGEADLDDLWGYGGKGGSSTWGGGNGSEGDYGASNGGDDTGASKKYAKAGGAGGSCVEPKAVAFYTYKDGASSNPQVTCTSGDGKTRSGSALSSQDAKSKGMAALSTQAESGSLAETVDGAEVTYDWEVAYFDESETKLESEPTEPGRYTVTVTITDSNGNSGTWSEPYTVKRQVVVPTPAELTFKVADWGTGDGLEQDAFPDLDETRIEFVGGSDSARSAGDAGEYRACFKLRDSETCEWADGSGSGEVWVPWSIELQELDFGSPEVTYWGTAYDDDTTSVAYTGKPIWVRPWLTPARETGGEFPEWATHWGSEGRPTTARNAACVFYLDGSDGDQGLVGYHTNADGTLEPVTAVQVYAWVNGVDIDGVHVAVEPGDRVWYRTGKDGWWVPVAVESGGLSAQSEAPEGAEGSIVARDYAYADKLGVMEPGTYQAYALIDDGAGFEPTSLAEATVNVTKAAPADTNTKASAGTKASSAAKTGDFPLAAVGGMALAALLAAGAIALSLARRRG